VSPCAVYNRRGHQGERRYQAARPTVRARTNQGRSEILLDYHLRVGQVQPGGACETRWPTSSFGIIPEHRLANEAMNAGTIFFVALQRCHFFSVHR
jgi:hypothetical protein